MASKGQLTGMLGVYMVAVELTKRGWIVSPTSRSAMGADLLVTDPRCSQAWSIQVKTNAKKATFWLCGKAACDLTSPSHIYVFVNAQNGSSTGKEPEFYVVPSATVAQSLKTEHRRNSVWYPFYRDDRYRDQWEQVLGKPRRARADSRA